MKVVVNLEEYQIDTMVVYSLKEAYRLNAGVNKIDNSEEKIDPDYEFLRSVDHVLEYYLNFDERRIWNQEKARIHEQEGTSPPNVAP
jgi:hypothetical protein